MLDVIIWLIAENLFVAWCAVKVREYIAMRRLEKRCQIMQQAYLDSVDRLKIVLERLDEAEGEIVQ